MSRRVIFFDIDGTLSTETDFTVPESTKKAIKLAQDNGHILMVNTGRTICIIEDVIKELGLDGYICGCGTNIYYHGKEIYHAKLPSELKKGIVNKAIELDIDAVLEGPESIYFPETIKTKTVQEIGSLTVVSNFSLTKSLKTLIISMLLSFFIVKFVKINILIWANVCYNGHRR